jgi:hypothetical protein
MGQRRASQPDGLVATGISIISNPLPIVYPLVSSLLWITVSERQGLFFWFIYNSDNKSLYNIFIPPTEGDFQ